MKHPLHNPSLAPFGVAAIPYRERLALEHDPRVLASTDCERLIALLWESVNRCTAQRPVPVRQIIHEILPSQAPSNRLRNGDFWREGKPYLNRDIMVLSSVVQWLGSNCGHTFLEDKRIGFVPSDPSLEFVEKLELEAPMLGLYVKWTHMRCTPACFQSARFASTYLAQAHAFQEKDCTERDRAVIDGIMRWLGTRRGRRFIFVASMERRMLHATFRRKQHKAVETMKAA